MVLTLDAIRILKISSQYAICAAYVTALVGFIGNAMNILVFTHFKFFQKNRCAFYLTIESVSNFVYLLCTLAITITVTINGTTLITTSLVWCRLFYVLTQTLGLVTFSMICLIAFDQFFSTSYQLRYKQVCTFKLARWLVFISILVCFLHGITCSFFVHVVPLSGCIVTNTILIRYFTYFFYPVLAGFIPIIIVTIFSLFTIRNIHQINRQQVLTDGYHRLDHQISAMVLIRIACFVIFVLPYICFRIYTINTVIDETNLLNFAIFQLIQAVIFSFTGLNNVVCFCHNEVYTKYFHSIVYF